MIPSLDDMGLDLNQKAYPIYTRRPGAILIVLSIGSPGFSYTESMVLVLRECESTQEGNIYTQDIYLEAKPPKQRQSVSQ